MEELLDVLRVPPGKNIDLKKDYDPGFTGKWMNNEEAEKTLAEGIQMLAEMQDKLWAQNQYALLMILHALPARGNIGIFNHSYYEEVLVMRVHPEILVGQKLLLALKDRIFGGGASRKSTASRSTWLTTALLSSSSSCTYLKKPRRSVS
jgi:polyphosphate kinase 2 (PPK2 family)